MLMIDNVKMKLWKKVGVYYLADFVSKFILLFDLAPGEPTEHKLWPFENEYFMIHVHCPTKNHFKRIRTNFVLFVRFLVIYQHQVYVPLSLTGIFWIWWNHSKCVTDLSIILFRNLMKDES